ncbi:MAG: nitroreductase/quinone reductase family protein [Candidatus Dormibacteraceae bacterium]
MSALPPAGTHGKGMPGGGAVKLMLAVNRFVYRLLRGRGLGKMILLTTVGAKTGRLRTNPLASFTEFGEGWLVVASAGGDRNHPRWLLNAVAQPDQVWVESRGRRVRVRASVLQAPERDQRWEQIVAEAPNFGEYQRSTDRQIPVVRLTRLPEQGS